MLPFIISIWRRKSSAARSEDHIAAELHHLGVTYLSNRPIDSVDNRRSPERLLADIICQPSSRVRTAIIALFLLHPKYAAFIPASLGLLNETQRQLLKLFYTAAVHLQRLYQRDLRPIMRSDWDWLPDLFAEELGIASIDLPQDAVQHLGIRHQQITHSLTNWAGTYKNVVHHLIRYKQRDYNGTSHRRHPNLVFEPIGRVVFLIKENLIDLTELQKHFQAVLPRASQADIIPSEFQQYLQDLLLRLAKE